MKKNVFYHVMMLAMIAVVSMTFTACGGDSDDGGRKPPKPKAPAWFTDFRNEVMQRFDRQDKRFDRLENRLDRVVKVNNLKE